MVEEEEIATVMCQHKNHPLTGEELAAGQPCIRCKAWVHNVLAAALRAGYTIKKGQA